MADPYVVADYWVVDYAVDDAGGGGVTDDYPDLPQCEGTKIIPRPGIYARRATNGSTRLRALQSVVKSDIVIEHGVCTAAQRTQFMDFYTAYRFSTFTFTPYEDDVQRTCVFAPQPYSIEPVLGGYFRITVNLIEQ